MLLDIKNTIKQSAIYGLSRISLKFVSFILTPVISIYFTVAEYGVLDRFERIWQIILGISLFGMETALLRWYTLTEEPQKKKSFIFSITVFLISINFILIFISVVFSKQFSNIIFGTEVYYRIIIYTFLIACFEGLMVIPLTIIRAQNKPFKYFIITITAALISMFLQLYFLLYSNNKLEGIFISKFIAPLLTFLIIIPYLIKNISWHFDIKDLSEVIKFSFPLMLTSIVSTILLSANRFILGFIGKSVEVGLFSLASNISGIITFILISPFQLAFNAIFWQKLKDANASRFFTKSVTYSFLFYVWGALVLSLLIPYIIKIYIPKSPEYWQAENLVPILSFSLVFYGMLTIVYMSYHHAKRNDLIFYFQSGILIFNILLNYILIPIFGMYGASAATFVSNLILIVIMYFFSRNYYFIKYETSKLIYIFLTASIIIVFFYSIKIELKWVDITLRILASISFPFLLYFLNIYEVVEISSAKSLLKKYLKINGKQTGK